MRRCITCALPDSRPDTFFDESGQCSACASYAKRPEIDWAGNFEALGNLLNDCHGEVIVPSSGGKDSTAQCLTLKEMGAHVTAVTVRPTQLSDIGRKNIDNLAQHVRTIEFIPEQTTQKKLCRIGTEMVGDVLWCEHVLIHRFPFRAAMDLGKKMIVFGENPLNAYGGPVGLDDAKLMSQRWVAEFSGMLGLRPEDLIGSDGIRERDIQDYLAPGDSELKQHGIAAIFLGQFLPWDSHANAALAKANGFNVPIKPPSRANWWLEENLCGYLINAHDYGMHLKYGYSRGTAQVSVDIRSGRISREQGIEIAERCERVGLDDEYLDKPIEEILDWCGMSYQYFVDTMNMFSARVAA